MVKFQSNLVYKYGTEPESLLEGPEAKKNRSIISKDQFHSNLI